MIHGLRHFSFMLFTTGIIVLIFIALGGIERLKTNMPFLGDRSYILHNVKVDGETVSDCAVWYYSDVRKTSRILEINSVDPRHLHINDSLKIPITRR